MKENFEIVKVADDYMLVPVGDQMDKFCGTVVLNEVSAFLLEKMKTDRTVEELISFLMNEYLVEDKTAQTDVLSALEKMKAIGVIDE